MVQVLNVCQASQLDMIQDDLDTLGPVDNADVVSAQQKMITIARKLKAERKIACEMMAKQVVTVNTIGRLAVWNELILRFIYSTQILKLNIHPLDVEPGFRQVFLCFFN